MCLLVRLVNILYRDNGQISVITEIPKSDPGTNLDTDLLNVCLREVKGNGYREEVAICQAIVLNDARQMSVKAWRPRDTTRTHRNRSGS